jgi:hypothetical protein
MFPSAALIDHVDAPVPAKSDNADDKAVIFSETHGKSG